MGGRIFTTIKNSYRYVYFKKLSLCSSDINVTLNNLRNRGYIIDIGPKTCRDPLNSRSSFLNCVDEQYRTCLYNLHLKFANTGILSPCLSRFKFHLEIYI